MLIDCPYLGRPVELTSERMKHIRQRHPELGEAAEELIQQCISDPDEIQISNAESSALLFTRQLKERIGGRFLVSVVVEDRKQAPRNWVVTAYTTGRPGQGEVIWIRS